MGLDNVKDQAIDSHEDELKKALEGFKEEGKGLKEAVREIDKDQLKQIIEKNFKNEGRRKTYQEMVKTPGYNFIVQAAIDLFGGDKSDMDTELGNNGGIDMIYGKTTTKLVRDIQQKLNITPDGKAGPKFFEAVLNHLNKSTDTQSRDRAKAMDSAQVTDRSQATGTESQQSESQVQQTREEPQQTREEGTQSTNAPQSMNPKGGESRMEIQNVDELEPSIDNFASKTKNMEMIKDENEEFVLGEHTTEMDGFPLLTAELSSENRDTPNAIYVKFGAGTDGTPVRSNKFTEETFEAKRAWTKQFVRDYFNGPNKEELLAFIDKCDFGTTLSGKGYTNEWLLGMRNLECVRGIIESYNKGAEKKPALQEKPLHLAYDPNMNEIGKTRDKKEERFGRIEFGFEYSETSSIGESDTSTDTDASSDTDVSTDADASLEVSAGSSS